MADDMASGFNLVGHLELPSGVGTPIFALLRSVLLILLLYHGTAISKSFEK